MQLLISLIEHDHFRSTIHNDKIRMASDTKFPSPDPLRPVVKRTRQSSRSVASRRLASSGATAESPNQTPSDTPKSRKFTDRFPSTLASTTLKKKKKKSDGLIVSTPPSTPVVSRRGPSRRGSLPVVTATDLDSNDSKTAESKNGQSTLPLNITPSLIPKTKKNRIRTPDWMSDRPEVTLTPLSPTDLLVL